MEHSFDYKSYAEALNRCISDMVGLNDDTDSHIPEYVRPVALLLGIGRIEADYYESAQHEKRKKKNTTLLFHDAGAYADSGVLETREVLSNGTVVHNKFYPAAEGVVWGEEEGTRLAAFEKLLTVFEERFKMRDIANYYINNDYQLNVRSMQYLTNKLGELLAQGRQSEFGLCYFDLKQFSLINDRIGRTNGTKAMKKYAEAVKEKFTDKEEVVARVSGDVFCILFYKEHIDTVLKCVNGIYVTTDVPEYSRIRISAKAGIYLIPDEKMIASDIIDKAGLAKKKAKEQKELSVVYFEETMLTEAKKAKRLQAMFPAAIATEEFLVYYQPKIHLQENRLMGAEALCRWMHNGELIAPDYFIPVFEKKGLTAELDFYMLEHVCRDLQRWIDGGKKAVPVSVNLSKFHMNDDRLFEHIMKIIDGHGISHELIELEFAESMAEVNFEFLKDIVTRLSVEGFSVSVDDFGTGVSSLNLIREMPWSLIKLDRSLLRDDGNGVHGQRMLGHIINMAKELGVKCICEGVEMFEQVQVLKENDCLMAQGFYFDKPLPAGVFEGRLEEME